MDLGGWLRSLGLEQYEAAFRENAIDDSVLPSLTAEDLKELGVDAVGHRRKLLNAIAALRADADVKAPLPDAATIDRSPKDEAERRQVTVMFADLVGSTALSTGMDPEDLREIISAYQKCVAETVHHFGGFVARYVGDGVLVYFGYPQAHEDDAERAVRAGLELITLVAGLKTRTPQQVRIGIATGLVVVGHLLATGESEAVGETPNLAARLQGIAEPNMVVIAESTRRLLGGFFQLDDLGMRSLKGIAGPVRAWAVLQASSVASRFEALHATDLTALVGRDEEFELLRRCFFKATDGEGQVVLLSGEAGIGKSRLTTAFVELLAGEPHMRLRYFCSPQHTDSALYPIIGQIERAAGLARDDSSQAKLDKLDGLLKQTSTPLMMGHRLMGLSLLHTGDIVEGRAHLDRAITFYDPAEHRPLATRFGQDIGAATLSWKSLGFWLLGYPEAALADSEHALKVAREIGHSATLMYVLNFSAWTHILCGNYAAANALVDEFGALKGQTGSLFWGAWGMMQRGCLLALTGKASDAVQTITCGLTAMRSTGTTMWMPLWLSYLTRANAEIGQFDNAGRCIDEAMAAVETAKETWCEAEVNRIGGEIALLSPEPDLAKAEAYFARALAVAREQQAKSWELRAAMSMARLWRDQGKWNEARKLLAPVYGWFSEGFDTRDLKEAKDLLGVLTSSGHL